jgi:hypothetical protein
MKGRLKSPNGDVILKYRIARGIQRFVRWLFGIPFQNLPSAFGDTVPSELRVFEAQAKEMQHHPSGHVSTPSKSVPGRGADSGHKMRF